LKILLDQRGVICHFCASAELYVMAQIGVPSAKLFHSHMMDVVSLLAGPTW